MLSQRLRLGARPLRFALGDLITPINALYVYLGLLGFYGAWLFVVVPYFGHGFLGVYARPMTLGSWLLIAVSVLHLVAQRRQRLQRGTGSPALGLGVLMLLVAVGLLVGIGRGMFDQNPYLKQYQQGMLVLFFVTAAVAYALPSQKEGARLVTIIAYFLTALTFAEFASVLSRFLGITQIKSQTLEFQYVIPFVAIYWFIRYLTSKGDIIKNALLLGIVVFGAIGRLQKPVVVPLFFALLVVGIVFLLAYYRHPALRGMTILKRALLLIVLVLAALILLEIIIPSSFLGDYRLIFYDRFLKVDPTTGVSEGRIDGGRLEYYSLAWNLVKANPLFGLGVGAAFPHPYISGRFSFPHSIILDFLLGYGIIGVLALFASIILIAIFLFLHLRMGEFTLEKATLSGYLFYAFLVSLVSYFWGHLPLVHATAISLGFILKMAILDARSIPSTARRIRLRGYAKAR